jgi:hypothetical protein
MRRVGMMSAWRTCLSPALRCLGEVLLQDVVDEDEEFWTDERTRNPVPAAVGCVLIRIQIIEQLRQCVLVRGGLQDPEARSVHIRNAGRDDGEADGGLRALEILEDRAGGHFEPIRRSALLVHKVNATAARPTIGPARRTTGGTALCGRE